MKRLLAVCLLLSLLLPLCGCGKDTPQERYSRTSLDWFDTPSVLIGYEEEKSDFDAVAGEVFAKLARFHQYFDIYHTYNGQNNLCTLNRQAGIAPVTVDRELFDFLVYAKSLYELTDGYVNVMLGSVIALWHEKREIAEIHPESVTSPPDPDAIASALAHTSIDSLVLDEAALTAYISDPLARIDVGALGKGYAAKQVTDWLRARGHTTYAINLGGNVSLVGTKGDGQPWTVGVESPFADRSDLGRLSLVGKSLVTSGSYQRYFVAGGVTYHHIIHPATGYPAGDFVSVTVMTEDSALADALSTALFLMPLAEGMALVASLPHVYALWAEQDGTLHTSAGWSEYLID